MGKLAGETGVVGLNSVHLSLLLDNGLVAV